MRQAASIPGPCTGGTRSDSSSCLACAAPEISGAAGHPLLLDVGDREEERLPVPSRLDQARLIDQVDAFYQALDTITGTGSPLDLVFLAEEKLRRVLGWLWDTLSGLRFGRPRLSRAARARGDVAAAVVGARRAAEFLPIHAACSPRQPRNRVTIGAEDFDGRVRDGIGYRLLAMTTRPAKDGTGFSVMPARRASVSTDQSVTT